MEGEALTSCRAQDFRRTTSIERRAGHMLPGEQRDGRGNGSCRDLSIARQVRDLPGFLALPLPFPDCRLRPAARNCSPFAARVRPAIVSAVLEIRYGTVKGLGPFAEKTLEQAERTTDGKTSRRRRNPHGVTKRCGRIAELGPRAHDRQAAGGMFFRPADWVFDREWSRAFTVVGEFSTGLRRRPYYEGTLVGQLKMRESHWAEPGSRTLRTTISSGGARRTACGRVAGAASFFSG